MGTQGGLQSIIVQYKNNVKKEGKRYIKQASLMLAGLVEQGCRWHATGQETSHKSIGVIKLRGYVCVCMCVSACTCLGINFCKIQVSPSLQIPTNLA